MKNILKTIGVLALLVMLGSCRSVEVVADYDKNIKFNNFKSFAFFKTGIDKANINDLDKRRILRAIETELLSKGFVKSETPDLLISLFTKSNQRVDIYNNNWGFGGWGGFGPGWGWGGFGPGWGWGWNQPNASVSTQGVLYIDLIDAHKKELIWQGKGTGYLTKNVEKKESRITDFVSKILEAYPPEIQ